MNKTILDLFENTALKYSAKIAIGDDKSNLTYDELMQKAKNIGAKIANKRFSRKPIALLFNRGCSLPVAMLAVMYSGNFYVVLDSNSPIARLKKIVNTLNPVAVIYESQFTNLVNQFQGKFSRFEIEEMEQSVVDCSNLTDIRKQMLSTDPAYSIFTSGSTGSPKGVLISHQNVTSYIDWFTTAMKISDQTVFGSQTPLHFSMSVSDFYATIAAGASYYMIPQAYFAFPAKLVDFMNERQVNTIYWVPTALGMVAKFNLFEYCKPAHLNKVLFAGEVMPIKYLNYWRSYLPNAMYANLFGPTETTDICTYYVVDRDFNETETLPIGIPCDNCRVFVIDENGNETTESGKGELYVAGPFVAKGYYGNTHKTKQSFVQNPLHTDYPEILYKTGDLVAKNKYGELEYLGRKDYQIKHNGYRIELGEIQAAFGPANNIGLTICLYDDKKRCLVLIYEGLESEKEQLLKLADTNLPEYMRPDKYIAMDCFPKNANGKIDKKLLKKMIIKDGESKNE